MRLGGESGEAGKPTSQATGAASQTLTLAQGSGWCNRGQSGPRYAGQTCYQVRRERLRIIDWGRCIARATDGRQGEKENR